MRSSLARASDHKSNVLPGTTTRATHDAALIERIAQGDRDAMLVLFTGHQVRVFRFILRFIGDRTLAEDLTSEVFLTAGNIQNLLSQSVLLAVVAFGATFVIISREIDLSVGAGVGLVSVLASLAMVQTHSIATGVFVGLAMRHSWERYELDVCPRMRSVLPPKMRNWSASRPMRPKYSNLVEKTRGPTSGSYRR